RCLGVKNVQPHACTAGCSLWDGRYHRGGSGAEVLDNADIAVGGVSGIDVEGCALGGVCSEGNVGIDIDTADIADGEHRWVEVKAELRSGLVTLGRHLDIDRDIGAASCLCRYQPDDAG